MDGFCKTKMIFKDISKYYINCIPSNLYLVCTLTQKEICKYLNNGYIIANV